MSHHICKPRSADVKQTQSMLFFLSKGYFASGNCKKEIDATLTNKNPIILLQETDPDRGGVPISQIHADCNVASQGEWLDQIFVPRRPVIPFLRVKEFKIISLKMIVASLLQHQRNGNEKISMEAKLKKADDESFKQHGSFALQRSTVQRSTGGSTAQKSSPSPYAFLKALSQKDSAHKSSHAFLKALNKKDNAVPEAAGSSNEKMAASASRSMDNPDATPDATPGAIPAANSEQRSGESAGSGAISGSCKRTTSDLARTTSASSEGKESTTSDLARTTSASSEGKEARTNRPLGSDPARLLRLLRRRLAALGSSSTPRKCGRLTERPATASGARASRLQSRQFHRL